MAAAGTSKQKKDTPPCGIMATFYQPEEVERMERKELNRIFLGHQETIREAFSIIREQERMLMHLQEQNNLNNADRYGSRSERSSQLKNTEEGTPDEITPQQGTSASPDIV